MVAEIQPQQYQYRDLRTGELCDRPRHERWLHADPARGYRFGGGEPVPPARMRPKLQAILVHVTVAVEAERFRNFASGRGFGRIGALFDSCFANLYRTGRDSLGWHADDERWMGPVIASVSLGATRRFLVRMKPEHPEFFKGAKSVGYDLAHGDLLIMHAGCQDTWEHSAPKTKKTVGPRLNLTFRTTA